MGGGLAVSNAALFMIGAVVVIVVGLLFATRKRAIVPDQVQSVAEMFHEFVASTIMDTAGKDGMRFFPFVFSLFMFELTCNLLGLIPGFFTVTSQVIITFALAVLVIGTVVVYGTITHGMHFLGLFVPAGVPKWLLPVVVVIEIISFLARPISLSLRLFANMLGGYRLEGVRQLRGFARRGRLRLCFAGPFTLTHDRCADRLRVLCCSLASLRLHGSDMHLSERCPASRPLIG